MTTPPNPSGCTRKPNSKFKKSGRGRKPAGKKKADMSRSQFTPEFIAWYGACRFLMCVATLLGPAFFDGSVQTKPQPAE